MCGDCATVNFGGVVIIRGVWWGSFCSNLFLSFYIVVVVCFFLFILSVPLV